MNVTKAPAGLQWRYATKKFDASKIIPEPVFQELLECLRLAPSSFGLQPWKFIAVKNQDLRKRLRPHAWDQSQITDASHLIVFCAKKTMTEADIDQFLALTAQTRGMKVSDLAAYRGMMTGSLLPKTQDQLSIWMARQVYIALGMLMTICAEQRIDTCPMEGFEPEKFDEILGLQNSDFGSVVLCALGYRAADDKYASAAKVRFAKEDVVLEIS